VERGTRVGGRYTLIAPLGAGRGGQVWAADDSRSGERVAIKLRHEPTTGLDVEVAGLRTLEHPHLVRILDAGIDAGVTYVVSEIVAQGSLETVAKPLAPAVLEALAAQMLDALAYLHAHGVLHSDVKTENVFVASLDPPRFKLGDFGFAHRFAAGAGLRGSPAFMPPETIRGEPADERSDLYALGITLYECAFGVLPFADDDVRRVLMRQLSESPVRLQDPGDVNPRLVALLRRLLPKEPAERPPDARAALAEWRGEEAGLPTWVPPRLGVLIGREDEMETLTRALAGDTIAVAIDGPPGIGKTRLLREFALRAELEGAQVEWWTPGAAASDEEAALDENASLARPSQEPLLLLVDDVETLSIHAREVAALRIRGTAWAERRSLVCVAGRGTAEKFLRATLAAGDLPTPLSLQLGPWSLPLIERACSALLGVHAVHPDLVRVLKEATGGFPASVEAACRVLVERQVLVRGSNAALVASVNSAELASSVGHLHINAISKLSASEQRLVQLLSLLDRPVSLDWLSGVHPTFREDFPALRQLGLVTSPPAGGGEYSIAHSSAREAALATLSLSDRKSMHDRLADAFDASGESIEANIHRAQGTDVWRAHTSLMQFVTTEKALYAPDLTAQLYEQLLAGWPRDLTPELRHDQELRFLDVLFRSGDSDRVLTAAEEMLSHTTNASDAQRLRNRMARVHIARGDGSAAMDALGDSEENGVESDLLRAAALARLGRHPEVLSLCERCLHMPGITDSQRNEAIDLQTSSLIALGRFTEAEVILTSAITRCESINDVRHLALHLSRLGPARFYQGRVGEAEAPLRRAYDLYRKLGDRMNEVRLLNSLAAACGETGQFREAGEHLRVALGLSRRIGASLTTFFVLANLAEMLATLGQFREAFAHATAAIELASRPGMHPSLVPPLICRAKMLATIGAVAECRHDVSRARTHELEPLHQAQLSMVLAECALVSMDYESASQDLAVSRNVLQSIGARDELADLGLLDARLCLAQGNLDGAIEVAAASVALASELGLVATKLRADVLIAEIALDIDPTTACTLGQAIVGQATAQGFREAVWRAQRVIARSAGLNEDFRTCVDGYQRCIALLREQCESMPPELADAYLSHPERARVLAELSAVHERLATT